MSVRGQPFQKGISGNPGGKPKSAEFSALARRYMTDMVRGAVGVARLDPTKHGPAVVQACRLLSEWGFPGFAKSGGDTEVVNHLHMHLLAVQQARGAVQLPIRPLPAPGLPGDPAGELDDDDEPGGPGDSVPAGMLPAPAAEPPEEALPLWDASKVAGHG